MTDVTHQQGFAHAMARMHMWLSGDDPELLDDYPQCRPIWVWCLAHNLAIGGALCRAHNIGEGSGYEWATRQPIWPRWEPGCNREARLAEEERKQPGAFADIYGDRSKWRAP